MENTCGILATLTSSAGRTWGAAATFLRRTLASANRARPVELKVYCEGIVVSPSEGGLGMTGALRAGTGITLMCSWCFCSWNSTNSEVPDQAKFFHLLRRKCFQRRRGV